MASLVLALLFVKPDAPPKVPVEPQSPRDKARGLAGQLWGDLGKTAHGAAFYREIYWRTANDNERLLVACKFGEQPLVEALVGAGADVNTVDHGTANHTAVEWEGATPLMMAANSGRQDLVEYLLQHGARVDLRDAGGENALHWAIRGGNEPLALLLLERGADPNAVGLKSNATPYLLAFGRHMDQLLAAMKARGSHF
ncbi:MAG: ankyrin repeat domain-containing protein [Fimbriimonadaceae bacterium]|nr:ankyrin repeat domain-containing protein [Fimbriimonadaceae bacterium]